jgi:hypothetical protein
MQQLLSESLAVWADSSWYLHREAAIALAAVSHTCSDGFLEVLEDAWIAGAPLPMPVVGKAAALYRQRHPPHGSRSHGERGAWRAELWPPCVSVEGGDTIRWKRWRGNICIC